VCALDSTASEYCPIDDFYEHVHELVSIKKPNGISRPNEQHAVKPLKPETLPNNAQQSTPFLKENTPRLHYKHHLVYTV
jgi:hypothetical protein